MVNNDNLAQQVQTSGVVPTQDLQNTKPDFSPSNEIKNQGIKNQQKLLLYFLIPVVLLAIGVFGYYFFIINSQVKNQHITNNLSRQQVSPSPPQQISAFQAKTISEGNTKAIAFTRGGDIWISSIGSTAQEKITTHTPVKYQYRNYLAGNWINAEWDSEFYIQPQLSGDGKYLAYLGIKKEAIEKLEKWKEDVKNEPEETKKSGDSIAFNPPPIGYEVKILNLNTKNNVNIADKLDNKSIDVDSYDLFEWARDKNILPLHWNSSIYFLDETGEGQFNIVSLDEDFFLNNPINPEWHSGEWDTPSGGIISPDGNFLISYYQFTTPAAGCFNTWGYKSYLIDLVKKKLTKIPLDTSVTCQSENVGWVKGNQFYILELRPNYDFEFSVWSDSLRQRVLGYKGQVSHSSISPDGKWLTYLIKNNETGASEYAFLNLQTKDATNLFGVMQEGGTKLLEYTTIFTPKWSRDSQYVIMKMTRKTGEISDLIRYNPGTKEYKVILENISDFDIN